MRHSPEARDFLRNAGELTAIRVPSRSEDVLRDLIRVRVAVVAVARELAGFVWALLTRVA